MLIMKIILIIVFLSGSFSLATSDAAAAGQVSQSLPGVGGQCQAVHSGAVGEGYCDIQQHCFIRKGKRNTANFLARYLHGNRKQKGVINLHVNKMLPRNFLQTYWDFQSVS